MSQKNSKAPWIIDLGASDHMIGTFQLFSSYTPCSNNLRVKIANGSLSIVAGSNKISENISCNLLSISKLTKDFSYIAKFSSSSCEFQELH